MRLSINFALEWHFCGANSNVTLAKRFIDVGSLTISSTWRENCIKLGRVDDIRLRFFSSLFLSLAELSGVHSSAKWYIIEALVLVATKHNGSLRNTSKRRNVCLQSSVRSKTQSSLLVRSSISFLSARSRYFNVFNSSLGCTLFVVRFPASLQILRSLCRRLKNFR